MKNAAAIDAVVMCVRDPQVAIDMIIEIAKKDPEVFESLEFMNPSWIKECKALVLDNKKVSAIKVCRQNTGWSLMEAKKYVEDL